MGGRARSPCRGQVARRDVAHGKAASTKWTVCSISRRPPKVKAVPTRGKADRRNVLCRAAGCILGSAMAEEEKRDAFLDYWRLRMDGISRRLEAARKIISHKVTRGSLAERTLAQQIEEFLPARWELGTGFILGEDGAESKQVDLLIYNTMTDSPLYRDGSVVALAPGTARVAVEVKSQLDKTAISESLANVASVREVDPALVGFVFAYDGCEAGTFAEHVSSWVKDHPDEDLLPDSFFNLSKGFVATHVPDDEADEGKRDSAKKIYSITSCSEPHRTSQPAEHLLQRLWAKLEFKKVAGFLPVLEFGKEIAQVPVPIGMTKVPSKKGK